jgi:hypothetical protein
MCKLAGLNACFSKCHVLPGKIVFTNARIKPQSGATAGQVQVNVSNRLSAVRAGMLDSNCDGAMTT